MAAARLLELLALAAKLLAHLLPKDRQRLLVVGDPRHDEVLLLDHRSRLRQLRDVREQQRRAVRLAGALHQHRLRDFALITFMRLVSCRRTEKCVSESVTVALVVTQFFGPSLQQSWRDSSARYRTTAPAVQCTPVPLT